MQNHEFLPHTADIAIKIHADNKEGLCAEAMRAMFLAAEPRYVEQKYSKKQRFSIKSTDFPALLIDFLNEVISLSDTYREAYDGVQFETLTDHHASGTLFGRAIAGFETQIKAATHHNDVVYRGEGSEWEAIIIFDA